MSAATIAEARVRKSYDFKFKKAVIKHAEENSNQEAARKYSVEETAASPCGWLLFTSCLA